MCAFLSGSVVGRKIPYILSDFRGDFVTKKREKTCASCEKNSKEAERQNYRPSAAPRCRAEIPAPIPSLRRTTFHRSHSARMESTSGLPVIHELSPIIVSNVP
jgi:hypothetical protein